jgi:hypothetical protein
MPFGEITREGKVGRNAGMRVGGAYYGMVLRQMESSGDEGEEVWR